MNREGLVGLFGPFVEPPSSPEGTTGWRPSGEPPPPLDDLHLETGRGTDLAPRLARVCETSACSLVGHAVGAVALVVVPLALSSSLPEPTGAVRAFFVNPMTAPPPPPPPPPPAPAAAAASRPRPAETPPSDAYFAPIEVPSEIVPEDGIDLEILGIGGETGGVAGGVPGGVVGGIVGGLPEAAPPPPVKPFRVGGDIKKPVKVKHVPPVYPELAAKARIEGIVIIEAQVDEQGRIRRTEVLRGVPVLNEAAVEAVRQWIYTPTLINGIPIPIVMSVTVVFSIG